MELAIWTTHHTRCQLNLVQQLLAHRYKRECIPAVYMKSSVLGTQLSSNYQCIYIGNNYHENSLFLIRLHQHVSPAKCRVNKPLQPPVHSVTAKCRVNKPLQPPVHSVTEPEPAAAPLPPESPAPSAEEDPAAVWTESLTSILTATHLQLSSLQPACINNTQKYQTFHITVHGV